MVTLFAMLSACGDDADEASPTTTASSQGDEAGSATRLTERTSLRVAVPVAGIESFAPVYLAKDLGVFEAENLDVEIVVLPAPDILTEVIRGNVDVYPVGFQANVFNAINAGNDLAYVAPVHTPPEASDAGIYVRTELVGDDGEFEACEFEGKSVSFGGAAGFAATAAWWFSDFIAECDLTLNDIELSTVGGAEQLIALESGGLDAAFLFDPLWSQAVADGSAELVVLGPKVALGGYLMGSLRTERPDVAAAFVRALHTTIETYLQGDYHSDPEVRAALISALGVPESAFDAGVSLEFDPSLQFDTSPIVPMQEVWIGVGDILQYDTPIEPERLIDPTVLAAALA
jgi:NitT/TauT family transport system substrate-binding protein